MASVLPVDLDYLVARLHGRRGHLAEGDRLDALCALRSLPDLVRALTPHAVFTSVAEFQQELILDMVQELADFAAQLTGAGSALMAWMRVRVQIENLKVLARAFATGKSGAVARKYLLPLPPDLALDFAALSVADSLESFIAATPSGVLRQGLSESVRNSTRRRARWFWKPRWTGRIFANCSNARKRSRTRHEPTRWRSPGMKWIRSI
jgi:hypothetical protein